MKTSKILFLKIRGKNLPSQHPDSTILFWESDIKRKISSSAGFLVQEITLAEKECIEYSWENQEGKFVIIADFSTQTVTGGLYTSRTGLVHGW